MGIFYKIDFFKHLIWLSQMFIKIFCSFVWMSKRFRSNSATGCWGRLRILCQATAGDAVLCPELLRGVWQRWRHDECGWVPHVLLSGRELVCHTRAFILLQVQFIFNELTSSFLSDPEAVRKKSQVPVRRSKFRTPCHSTSHQSGAEKEVSRLAQTLLLLPLAGLWPTSLQVASNTLSVSLFMC